MKIHPEGFNCANKHFCKRFSNLEMTEAKMTMLGSQYGRQYPNIAIISLDPPDDANKTFKAPQNRTTEYVSWFHEQEDYRIDRPNPHWAMTQIIVRDLLVLFGYSGQPGAAVVAESYAGRNIENVSAYFAHVNVAKCCMNNAGKGQADWQVHQKCGLSFLLNELNVLSPDFLISQGKDANTMLSRLFHLPGVEAALPAAKPVRLGARQALWLPMAHPTRHIAEIRRSWPFYVNAIRNWR